MTHTNRFNGKGEIYAVEPNADMRKKAEEKLSYNENYISVNGSDTDTNLSDRSVDYITAAQAFHWFDCDGFKKECRRILKPGGKVIIVYNSRNGEAACTKALAELRYRYNPECHVFGYMRASAHRLFLLSASFQSYF